MFRASQFYSPSAIYAPTPMTEEVACAVKQIAPEPVWRWELPALPSTVLDNADAMDAYEVDVEPPSFESDSSLDDDGRKQYHKGSGALGRRASGREGNGSGRPPMG